MDATFLKLQEAAKQALRQWQDLKPVYAMSEDDFYQMSQTAAALCESWEALEMDLVCSGVPIEQWKPFFDVALLLMRLGDHPSAIRWLRCLQRQVNPAEDASILARLSNMEGNVLQEVSRYGEAQGCYRRAYQLYLRAMGPDTLRCCLVLNNLGTCLVNGGEYDEAEEMLEKAFGVSSALPASEFGTGPGQYPRDYIDSVFLNNFAFLFSQKAEDSEDKQQQKKWFDQAEELLLKSLDLGPNRVLDIKHSCHLAHNMILQQRFDEAEKLLTDMEGLAKSLSDCAPTLPGIYFLQANLALAKGHLGRGLDICHMAMRMSQREGALPFERAVTDTFLDIVKAAVDNYSKTQDTNSFRFLLEEPGAKLLEDLILFLEQKDAYTGLNHSKSVAALSVRLGKALLLNGVAIEGTETEPEDGWGNHINLDVLRLAGLVHDIGKLSIPWSLLNKIGRPNLDEMDALRSHALKGQVILDQIGLPELGRIIVEHHETPCGDGYPHGKTDSSLMGAIVALADAFEAATTIKRRWRPAKSRDDVIKEAQALANIQFDERVVAVLPQALGLAQVEIP